MSGECIYMETYKTIYFSERLNYNYWMTPDYINSLKNIDSLSYKEIYEINSNMPFKELLALHDIKLVDKNSDEFKLIVKEIKKDKLDFFGYIDFAVFDNNIKFNINNCLDSRKNLKKLFSCLFNKPQFKHQLKYLNSCWIVNFENSYFLFYSDAAVARPDVAFITSENKINEKIDNYLTFKSDIIKITYDEKTGNEFGTIEDKDKRYEKIQKLNNILNHILDDVNLTLLERIKESSLVNKEIKLAIRGSRIGPQKKI